MNVQHSIEHKLRRGLQGIAHLEVVNESHNHGVPPGSQSHFKVVVVASDFEGKPAVARHQLIYRLLAEEMKGPVHALALHTYTGADWQAREAGSPSSPQCLGGGKCERAGQQGA